MLSVSSAQRTVLGFARQLPPEKVSLVDAAGRVLAEDVIAPRSLPPHDNSAMDGCACRHEDVLRGDPLRLVHSIPAGGEGSALGVGESAKIMTGAPIPDGADTVVPVEDVRFEDDHVYVLRLPSKGAHVRAAGEDVKAGEMVLSAGTLIRPAEVGMLASLGRSFVAVPQRPRVGILSTGNELADLDAPHSDSRIRDANAYALSSLVREAGGVPVRFGIVQDSPEALAAAVSRGFHFDLLISSGGVSAGDYDFLPSVLLAAGVEIHFHKVAIKPGKPVLFGTRERALVFGLPGNPVACFVCFEQFVRPALRKLQGREDPIRPIFEAVLDRRAGPVKHKPGRTEFRRCCVIRDRGGFRIAAVQRAGSGLLSTLVRANAFLVLEAESTGAVPGESVMVQPYDESFFCMPEMPVQDNGAAAAREHACEHHGCP